MDHLLPAHLRASIDRYVSDGVPTGDFLRACLENDLACAIGRADEDSMRALPAVVSYLYNEIPSTAWGSPERVAKWIATKRNERAAAECERTGKEERP